MSITYIRFHSACKAQNLDRKALPYTGWLQPWCAYWGLFWFSLVTLCYGYAVFRSGGWNLKSFFGSYTILGVDVLLLVGWKLLKKTRFKRVHEIDLVWERPTIDAYEATFIDPPVGFWQGEFSCCADMSSLRNDALTQYRNATTGWTRQNQGRE